MSSSASRPSRVSIIGNTSRWLPPLAATIGFFAFGSGVVRAQTPAVAPPAIAPIETPAIAPIPAVAPAPIAVTVDGAGLDFPLGVAAIEQNGRVLVPLRGIFERLGAKVKFDAPTHSIVAKKGEIDVILQLGNTTAFLNGTPHQLSAPAQLAGGTTAMVPLRFVSEALGAKVKWDPATRSVRIFTAEALAANPAIANTPIASTSAPAATEPAAVVPMTPPATVAAPAAPPTAVVPQTTPPATAPTTPPTTAPPPVVAPPVTPPATTPAVDTPISGTLTADDFGTTPSVTVHVTQPAPDDVTVLLTPDAKIAEKRGDDPATPTTIPKLRFGDQVVVKRNAAGMGIEVEADFVEAKGVLKALTPGDNGVSHLTLADDSTVDVAAATTTTLEGNSSTLTALKPRMTLTIRQNPVTKQGLTIAATLPEVKITALNVTGADKTLTAADTVNVTLVGTPGGAATVTVAGLPAAYDLPLTEMPNTPGTYTGSVSISAGYVLDKAVVVGNLTIDPATAPAFTSPATLVVDSQPPTFTNIEPVDLTTISDRHPDIAGDMDDKGSGIDPSKFQFTLNGKDITSQVKVTKNHFLYHPVADLPPSSNLMTVTVKDMAGNVAQESWGFTIIPTVSPLKVVTITVPTADALQANDVIHIRAEATPGGSAQFAIGPNNLIHGAMTEEKPGIYTGFYTVLRGDSAANARVTVTFTPPGGGDAVTSAAIQKVTLAAGAPVPPIIDKPQEGASTGAYVTISGHGTPNSTVRLTISYSGKVVVLKKSGDLTNLDIAIGPDGLWTTDTLTLDTGNAGSVTFTATAITVLNDGEMSSPAVVRFKK